MIQAVHSTQAQHSVRDITLCDLTLPRVTLIVTDKMSTREQYLTTQQRLRDAVRDGWRLKIYDAEVTIDATLGLYIVECRSEQLELI